MRGATEDQKAHDFMDNSNMSSTLSHLLSDNCHQPCLILFTTSPRSVSLITRHPVPHLPRETQKWAVVTHMVHTISLSSHTHICT